jgi:DNA-binding HxlR family transcriptional regulator
MDSPLRIERRDGRWAYTDEHGRRGQLSDRGALIVVSLADGELTIDRITADWPGLTDAATRSRVRTLERAGLVQRARWNGRAWTYTLTRRGQALCERIGDFLDA